MCARLLEFVDQSLVKSVVSSALIMGLFVFLNCVTRSCLSSVVNKSVVSSALIRGWVGSSSLIVLLLVRHISMNFWLKTFGVLLLLDHQ